MLASLPGPQRLGRVRDLLDAPAAVCGLLGVIARDLDPDELPWPVARHLIDATGAQTSGLARDLNVLAVVAERENGLLNVGEPWAETADAEPEGCPMLAHALRVTGSRPLVRWSREARELDLPTGWRQRIHRWFALVPLPRTIGFRRFDYFDADELIDVYNATALRGLLFLLAVTEPVPEDAAAVGALAEYAATKVRGQGARDLVVANAAILSLELIGTAEALDELERLRAARLQPGMITRVVKAASRCRATLGRL